MKKINLFIFLFSAFFIFNFVLFNISFAQISNQSKLNLPFSVNFTASELRILDSLSQSDLEKLIRIVKLIIERNTNNQVQDLSVPTYSNSQTAQTPYYNSSTGQYQSTPVSSNNSLQNSQSNNPYSNNLPFSGQQQSPFSPTPFTTPQVPDTALGAIARGINTGLADNTPNGTCPNSTGVTWVHDGIETCPDDIGPNPIMRKTLLEACQKIQKPIIARTIYRPTSCNSGASGSNHTRGSAIDMYFRRSNNTNNLTEKEAIIVLQTFRKNGFTGYGCYPNSGPNYVHLSISNTERYGSNCPPELTLSGYR